MTDRILTERNGAVATITLNWPERLNAFSVASWGALADTMNALSADRTLSCVVVRGAGEKAFAAGADIGEFETHRANSTQGRVYGSLVERAIAAVRGVSHPTVAAIQGACIGGGLEIAVACDIRIATEGSRFGAPVTNLGLTMSHAELRGIVGLIGPARTMELLFEARLIDSAQAAAWGLVNRVVPGADFDQELAAMVARITAGAPLVARWHKRFVQRVLDTRPLDPTETDEAFACFNTADFAEGRRAFSEKRKPVFEGN